MAEVIRYVDPDATGGGTGVDWTNAYTSLSAWESNEQTDLVNDGNWMHVYCRASSGTEDGDAFTISGWTTGVANYILIEAADGDQAVKTGIDSSRYRLTGGGAYFQRLLTISVNNVRLKGIQIDYAPPESYSYAIYLINLDTSKDADIRIDSCYIRGSYVSSFENGVGIKGEYHDFSGNTCRTQIYNTVITDVINGSANTMYAIDLNTNLEARIFNCIIKGNYNGIQRNGNTVVKNSAVFDNANDFSGSGGTVDYNASDDGDGTNPVAPSGGNWNNEFIDPDNDDFTLKNSGNLFEAGADNPSSGLYTTDMEGDAYNVGGYSLGVDEFVSVVTDVFFEMLSQIEQGIKPLTAAGLGGVLQE